MDAINLTGDLYCLDENPSGTPVVMFLHGLGATSASWAFQIPELTACGMRVLVPDIPGFGRSPWTRGWRWSVPRVARVIAGLVERTGSSPLSVVGISMGGAIALQLTLDYPWLVDRVGLINTFACLRPNRAGEWAYYVKRFLLMNAKGLAAQADFVAQRIFPEPDQTLLRQAFIEEIMQSDRAAYRRAMLGLGLFDVTRRLGSVRCPVLVVTGERDTTVPPAVQKRLADRLPEAHHVTIPGAGHAVSVDHPTEFNTILKSFLMIAPGRAAQPIETAH